MVSICVKMLLCFFVCPCGLNCQWRSDRCCRNAIRGWEKHSESRKNVRVSSATANKLFTSEKKASVLKRDLIKESQAEMFEPDKGRVISESAIRSGQSRNRQMNKLSTDPLKSLEFLSDSHSYGSMIHSIGNKPFFVIYASANQYLLYNAYKKAHKYSA